MKRTALASIAALAASLGLNMIVAPQAANDGRVDARSGNTVTDIKTSNNTPADRLRLTANGVAAAMRTLYGSGKPQRPKRPGPGWTHAQVQRMSRKKRNQKANKRAHRG